MGAHGGGTIGTEALIPQGQGVRARAPRLRELVLPLQRAALPAMSMECCSCQVPRHPPPCRLAHVCGKDAARVVKARPRVRVDRWRHAAADDQHKLLCWHALDDEGAALVGVILVSSQLFAWKQEVRVWVCVVGGYRDRFNTQDSRRAQFLSVPSTRRLQLRGLGSRGLRLQLRPGHVRTRTHPLLALQMRPRVRSVSGPCFLAPSHR